VCEDGSAGPQAKREDAEHVDDAVEAEAVWET
jgi:hypothetical protein